MTQSEINNKIQNSLNEGIKCRIYFKAFDRTPMYGKFVSHEDAKELSEKSLVRFVSEGKLSFYDESKALSLTRIFNVTSFSSIQFV